jgi:hypothetical protein
MYSLHPLGPALVNLPLTFVGNFIFSETGDVVKRAFRIAELSAKAWAALSVALFYVLGLLITERRGLSLALALALAFATPHFGTHGAGYLWSHNVDMPFLLVALILWLWRDGEYVHYAAIPLLLAYMSRPSVSLFIIATCVYILMYHRRAFLRFALLGGVMGMAFAAYSYSLYGHILPHYYQGFFWLDTFAGPLAAQMVSPNRGLLIFCPILVFSFYGIVAVFRKTGQYHPVYRFCAAVFLAHWIVISVHPFWWGGSSYGPRLFSDVLVLPVLLLFPAYNELKDKKPWLRRAAAAVFALLLLFSVFVQYRAVSSREVHDWNKVPVHIDADAGRVWDWEDMQIFRGL